jgi:hypothetical protein
MKVTLEEFKNIEDKNSVDSISYYTDTLVKCNKSRKALNKTLETNFKSVYRKKFYVENNKWSENDIGWDAEDFVVVTPSDKVLFFTNSEWGGVEIPKF